MAEMSGDGSVPIGNLLCKMYYMETRKGLLVALEPTTSLLIITKAAVISVAALGTAPSFQQAAKAFPEKLTNSIVKETCCVTTKSILQSLAVQTLSRRMAHKLMKDVKASAIRKMALYGNRGTAAMRMFKTGALACFLSHLAVLLVEECMAYYSVLTTSPDEKQLKQEELIRDCKHNLNTMVASIVLQGFGTSIGTLVRPGLGSVIGGLAGGSLPYVLL